MTKVQKWPFSAIIPWKVFLSHTSLLAYLHINCILASVTGFHYTSLFRCLEKYVNDQRPSLKYQIQSDKPWSSHKKDHFLFSTITRWKLLQPYSNLHMNCIFSVLYVSKSTTWRPPAKNNNPGRKYHFQPYYQHEKRFNLIQNSYWSYIL